MSHENYENYAPNQVTVIDVPNIWNISYEKKFHTNYRFWINECRKGNWKTDPSNPVFIMGKNELCHSNLNGPSISMKQ